MAKKKRVAAAPSKPVRVDLKDGVPVEASTMGVRQEAPAGLKNSEKLEWLRKNGGSR